MQTGTITSNLLIGGVSFTSTVNRQAEGVIGEIVTLPAGKAGAISVAGGVDGLATGYGIDGGDVIDLHWVDVDGNPKCRRGITIDTAGANAVTFAGSPAPEGDALPAEDTAVVVSKQVNIDLHWDGNATELMAARCDGAAMLDFRTIDSASDAAVKLTANEAWSWANGQGIACPIINTIAAGVASNGTTAARTLQVVVLYRSLE